jgi:hypothetical protein
MDKKERIRIIESIISYIKVIDIDYPQTMQFKTFHNNNNILIEEVEGLLEYTKKEKGINEKFM